MFSIANWLQVIIKVLMNPSRAVDQARFYLFCFRTNALLTMVILAHVIAVLQWVSSWLQVGSASLSLSVLLTAIFVGEGKTVPPSTSTTHIRDNSVMSNNINNLPRVNHLGNVSISNQSSATFSSVSCHLAMTESAAHWEINECWAAVDLQSLIWAVTGPDGSRGLPSHLSGGRQSESGHHPVISQPGRGWERPPLWPPLYLVRICDIQLLFRPTSVRSSWCMCKNCLQWKIGE